MKSGVKQQVNMYSKGGKEMSLEKIRQDYKSFNEAVKEIFGENAEITKRDYVYGGSINDSRKMSLSTGDIIFVKTNTIENKKFFETEIAGLKALDSVGKIGVPEILGSGTDQDKGVSFLILEYLESPSKIENYWEEFGHQLAGLHKAECSRFVPSDNGKERYGFLEDNFIGAGPQINTPKEKWVDFYRECRLLPQIKRAENYFDPDTMRKLDRLLERLESFLEEPAFPSLLHGDLWGGNVMCGSDGKAWIIDPAAYVGDFEADLAMTQLFGGFPTEFYSAYNEVNPISVDYPQKRDFYQLYHLLNHLNLFGRSYFGNVIRIIRKYV